MGATLSCGIFSPVDSGIHSRMRCPFLKVSRRIKGPLNLQVMGNPVEIREWNLQGLPADVRGTKHRLERNTD